MAVKLYCIYEGDRTAKGRNQKTGKVTHLVVASSLKEALSLADGGPWFAGDSGIVSKWVTGKTCWENFTGTLGKAIVPAIFSRARRVAWKEQQDLTRRRTFKLSLADLNLLRNELIVGGMDRYDHWNTPVLVPVRCFLGSNLPEGDTGTPWNTSRVFSDPLDAWGWLVSMFREYVPGVNIFKDGGHLGLRGLPFDRVFVGGRPLNFMGGRHMAICRFDGNDLETSEARFMDAWNEYLANMSPEQVQAPPEVLHVDEQEARMDRLTAAK